MKTFLIKNRQQATNFFFRQTFAQRTERDRMNKFPGKITHLLEPSHEVVVVTIW